jgi:hypothetical protein
MPTHTQFCPSERETFSESGCWWKEQPCLAPRVMGLENSFTTRHTRHHILVSIPKQRSHIEIFHWRRNSTFISFFLASHVLLEYLQYRNIAFKTSFSFLGNAIYRSSEILTSDSGMFPTRNIFFFNLRNLHRNVHITEIKKGLDPKFSRPVNYFIRKRFVEQFRVLADPNRYLVVLFL